MVKAALLAPADTVLALGDNAYPDGSLAQYERLYDPTWGAYRGNTCPAPGNHEYQTPDAGGCRAYFGARATPARDTWYWFDPGSPQYTWLEHGLSTSTKPCVLAYRHPPRFRSAKHGVDHEHAAVLEPALPARRRCRPERARHSHERFTPLAPDGQAEPGGIREFLGTGRRPSLSVGPPEPGSEVRQNHTHGVLRLTLRASGYDWRFLPVAGDSFTDRTQGTAANAIRACFSGPQP